MTESRGLSDGPGGGGQKIEAVAGKESCSCGPDDRPASPCTSRRRAKSPLVPYLRKPKDLGLLRREESLELCGPEALVPPLHSKTQNILDPWRIGP